jgi:hypothetical protein
MGSSAYDCEALQPDEILGELRKARVERAQKATIAAGAEKLEVTDRTFCRRPTRRGRGAVVPTERLRNLGRGTPTANGVVTDRSWTSRFWKEGPRGPLGPERRAAVVPVRQVLREDAVSERRASQVLGQPRSTWRRSRRPCHSAQ